LWAKHRPSFDLYISDFAIQEASRGASVAAAERLKALAGIPSLPASPGALALTEKLAAVL
jgi:hypothetical protein